jgi:DNA-binding GntR family transcriptional regulator
MNRENIAMRNGFEGIESVEKTGQSNKTKTLIEEAYRNIKQMIYEQKLVPGQRLVYQDLGDLLHMSRTPIIIGLNRLEQDGFVAYETFRGFYVKPLDPQEVWDAFGVREALETYAVEQAIKLGNAEDMKELEEKLLAHKTYKPHYYTRKKFLLDSEFHVQIAAMSKNRVLKLLLRRNFEHVYLRARLENYDPRRMDASPEEHWNLIKKMKKKDVIGSIELIKNHIQAARDHVLRCLSENESERVEIA